jgi:predicted DNA-binding transcriptional regulator YafY
MRSQRLVSCLLLLQGGRRQTARALADALEVSTRTVYRDVDALSSAGVPVHMERGPQGGIVLADDYRRALAQFTSDELQALFASTAGPMADLGIASHAQALQKLAGALPASQRRTAEHSRDQLLLDHNRWYRGVQPTLVLTTLRRAATNQRRVRLGYRDRTGSITQRLVEPLGLVAKAGIWYLVAFEADKGYRTFRAERINSADETDLQFTRPADFNLDAYWRSSVASMEQRPSETYEVMLRVRSDALAQLTYWEFEMLDESAGVATLRIRFAGRNLAIFQVLALGEAVTIVEPPELREAVVACARAALAQHAY